MTRTFVVEELKRTFLLGISAAAATALLTAITEQVLGFTLRDSRTLKPAVDGFIVFTLVLVAATSGAAAYSAAFRNGPLRLLENLPISRYRIWAIRLIVCLLTAVASAGILVVSRPALLNQDQESMLTALGIGFLFFTAGAVWPLGLRVSAAISTTVVLLLTAPIIIFLGVLDNFSAAGDMGSKFLMDRSLWIAGCVMVCTANLLCSVWVFTRGEHDLPRRRISNIALFAVVLVGMLTTVTLLADTGVLAYNEQWSLAKGIGYKWYPSPDHRYIALLLAKENHVPITKVVILDIDSGAVIKTFSKSSIRNIVWTREGSLLAFTDGSVLERVLGFGYGKARVIQILPDEKKIFQRERAQYLEYVQVKGGPYLVLQSPSLSAPFKRFWSVLRLNATGESQEVFTTPLSVSNSAFVEYAENGFFLQLFAGTSPDEGWLITDRVRLSYPTWGPLFFETLAERESTRKEFAKTSPRSNKDSESKGVYVWSDQDTVDDNNSWRYFLERTSPEGGRLYGRRKGDADWKEVLSELPLPARQVQRIARAPKDYVPASEFGLWTGARNGIVVRLFPSPFDAKRILLADLVTGERFDFEIGSQNGWVASEARVSPSVRANRLTIRLLAGVSSAQHILPYQFVFQPGHGMPTREAILPPESSSDPRPMMESRTGTGVFVEPDKITAVSKDGTRRTLWPQ